MNVSRDGYRLLEMLRLSCFYFESRLSSYKKLSATSIYPRFCQSPGDPGPISAYNSPKQRLYDLRCLLSRGAGLPYHLRLSCLAAKSHRPGPASTRNDAPTPPFRRLALVASARDARSRQRPLGSMQKQRPADSERLPSRQLTAADFVRLVESLAPSVQALDYFASWKSGDEDYGTSLDELRDPVKFEDFAGLAYISLSFRYGDDDRVRTHISRGMAGLS
jgi:hypothetical protein